jgi:membrane dipeptidase
VRRRDVVAGLLLSPLASLSLPAAARNGPDYSDGLSFLPDDPADLAASGLRHFICDVSKARLERDAEGNPYYHRSFELCDQGIDDAARRVAVQFPDLVIAKTGSDVGGGKRAAVLQFQSCEPIETDLTRMSYFHGKSLRVLQITHNESNAFGAAYMDEHTGAGLTALGIEGVREMNRIGLIPDISHAADATALQTLSVSARPVILSHGSCRALLDHPRAATDNVIRAVGESGGVFGVFMMSFWLTDEALPTEQHLVRHVRHAIDTAGIDAVGLANDYPMSGLKVGDRPFDNDRDMAATYLPWWEENRRRGRRGFDRMPRHAVIPSLNVIDRMPRIEAALARNGFTENEIEKVMGGNWTRFLQENLR